MHVKFTFRRYSELLFLECKRKFSLFRIKIQKEAVHILRSIASKCLSMKMEDLAIYSKFEKRVKEIFLENLKSERAVEPIKRDDSIRREEITENDNQM